MEELRPLAACLLIPAGLFDRRRAGRSDHQQWTVRAEAHANAVSNWSALDQLPLNAQPVAALEVADEPLAPVQRDLGMPPADVCVLNLDLAFEVAADEEGSLSPRAVPSGRRTTRIVSPKG